MAAPGGPKVQVEGATEFRRALKVMGADLKEFTKINKAAAEIVARRARQNAPRKSGKLAGAIKAGARQTRGFVSAGKKAVPYAGPIHYGWPTRNIEAQPFLLDAVDDTRDEVVDQYERMIADMVVRVGRTS